MIYGGVVALVLSIDDIIAAKKATGKTRDRIQARELQRARSELSNDPRSRLDGIGYGRFAPRALATMSFT